MTPEAEKYIREIIRGVIDETAFEELKKLPSKKETFFNELKKDAQKRNNLAHSALFFGGNENNLEGTRKRINIGEGMMPKINKTDIEKFEQEFQHFIPNSTIHLDTQGNGHSLSFPKIPEGMEVYASGNINFGQGQVVNFKLSLINGIIIDMVNFKPTQDNKNVVEQLYNFYHTWSEHWRTALNGAPAGDGGNGEPTPPAV